MFEPFKKKRKTHHGHPVICIKQQSDVCLSTHYHLQKVVLCYVQLSERLPTEELKSNFKIALSAYRRLLC